MQRALGACRMHIWQIVSEGDLNCFDSRQWPHIHFQWEDSWLICVRGLLRKTKRRL
jgi:hypothetical protein